MHNACDPAVYNFEATRRERKAEREREGKRNGEGGAETGYNHEVIMDSLTNNCPRVNTAAVKPFAWNGGLMGRRLP